MSRIMWTFVRRLRGPAPAAAAEPAPFDPAARGTWAWTQPARFRPAWTLAVDGTVVGTLALHGAFRNTAEARFHAGAWTLRPRFPGDVLATAPGAESPAARYHPGWLAGGRIERPGRDALLWRRERIWRTQWGIFTTEKLPLVHLAPRRALFLVRREAQVELEDAARRMEDLPLLLALAWFLALRTHHAHGAH